MQLRYFERTKREARVRNPRFLLVLQRNLSRETSKRDRNRKDIICEVQSSTRMKGRRTRIANAGPYVSVSAIAAAVPSSQAYDGPGELTENETCFIDFSRIRNSLSMIEEQWGDLIYFCPVQSCVIIRSEIFWFWNDTQVSKYFARALYAVSITSRRSVTRIGH